MPERSLVRKAQVRAAVGERKAGADVRRQRAIRVTDQQLAAHAQVGQHRLTIVQGEPEVLTAAFGLLKRTAGHGGLEPGRAPWVAADGSRVHDPGSLHRPSHGVPFKARTDGLNLGKLGHERTLLLLFRG
jgi:hypothetical protein